MGEPSAVTEHLDGSSTEYFPVPCDEATLLALLRETFEERWDQIIFGPCIEGAVFEGRFAARPRVTLLDGYVTAEIGGAESWHFHLCIGPHHGSPGLPTPPELAAWRRCSRAAFFVNRDRGARPSAWGLRLWNGRDEQMLTVFFPNPWLDPSRQRYVDAPDWARLDAWMAMRARYAGVPAEPPPSDAAPPRTH